MAWSGGGNIDRLSKNGEIALLYFFSQVQMIGFVLSVHVGLLLDLGSAAQLTVDSDQLEAV